MSKITKRLSSGSRFEDMAAYSRAVIDDGYIYISGTVGLDPDTKEMPEDVTAQTRNIFRIIEGVLGAEGASLADVVRNRVYLVDGSDVPAVAAIMKEKFDACRPANTTLLCGIPAPGAKVEIEVTARKPD